MAITKRAGAVLGIPLVCAITFVPFQFSLCHRVTRGTTGSPSLPSPFPHFPEKTSDCSHYNPAGTGLALEVGAVRVAATNEFHLWQKF